MAPQHTGARRSPLDDAACVFDLDLHFTSHHRYMFPKPFLNAAPKTAIKRKRALV
jgi:hypothetical protein